MMKILIAAMMVLSISANAKEQTKKRSAQKRICDSFQAKEDLECAHIMCDDDVKNGTWKDLDECTSAEDYAEAAQGGCESQDTTVEVLEKRWNKKHPKFQVKCD